MPDRERKDHHKRDRIDELAESWKHAVARLDARYKKVALLSLASTVIAVFSIILYILILQGQRWSATFDSCERQNQTAEAVVAVLRDFGAEESGVLIAQRRFPHVPPLAPPRKGAAPYTGPMTCKEYASDRVGGPKIK